MRAMLSIALNDSPPMDKSLELDLTCRLFFSIDKLQVDARAYTGRESTSKTAIGGEASVGRTGQKQWAYVEECDTW